MDINAVPFLNILDIVLNVAVLSFVFDLTKGLQNPGNLADVIFEHSLRLQVIYSEMINISIIN